MCSSQKTIILDRLNRELVDLFLIWKEYSYLFRKSKTQVELLNKTAGGFFSTYQRLSLDSILLKIGKLFDPAKIGRNGNCSLFTLLTTEKRLAHLEGDLEKIKEESKAIRQHRNKRIAHLDLQVANGEIGLESVTAEEIDQLLSSLSCWLNKVNLAQPEESQLLHDMISSRSGAETLLRKIAEREILVSKMEDSGDRMRLREAVSLYLSQGGAKTSARRE